MLLDRTERFVVSSLGWVDKGTFVQKNLESGQVTGHVLSKDGFVKLTDIDGDRFLAAAFDWEAGNTCFDVRRFAEPATSLWSLRVALQEQEVSGDPTKAIGTPRFHVNTFSGDTSTGRLIELATDFGSAILHDLPWYGEKHDLGYQGLVDAVALPNSAQVLIGIQRSSRIVIHDLSTGTLERDFELAGRNGNPKLDIVGNELWTIDYDTFVRIDLRTFHALGSVLLQPSANGTGQFAGSMYRHLLTKKIAVARPYSGDVIIVDPKSFKIEQSITIGRQPLCCIVTSTGRILTREWRNGEWFETSARLQKSKKRWHFW